MTAKRILRGVFLIALFASLAGVHSVSAQGTVFTYQGRLLLNGASANGNLDLTFRLYDDAVAGNQIGSTITNLNLWVTNGLVTLQLDFGASAFPGADRWLQIGVRPSGSTNDFLTLSPRQPLTSAPYAMQAASFTGAVQDAQLSANVARLDGTNAFTGVIKNVVGGTEFFMVPQGGIILWSGTAANIPPGWGLCDGSNGTPDLRDRFVVGAAGAYAVGDTGGAASHAHDTAIGTATSGSAGAHAHTTAAASTGTGTSGAEAAHTHSVNVGSTTSSSDAHSHTGNTLTFSREVTTGSLDGSGGLYFALTSGTSTQAIDPIWGGATSSDSHSHTVDPAAVTSATGSSHSHSVPALSIPALATDSQGAHTHSVAIGTVISTSVDSRPPYYALCYIMKL